MVDCYPPDLTANPPRKDYEGHVDFIQLRIAKGGVVTAISAPPLAQRNFEWNIDKVSVDVSFDAAADWRPEGEETRLVSLVLYNKDENVTAVSAPVSYREGDVSINNLSWEPGSMVYGWLIVQDFKDTVTMGRYLSYWNNGTPTAEAKASFEALQKGADYADSKLIGSVAIPDAE